jgi:hypothetical protein
MADKTRYLNLSTGMPYPTNNGQTDAAPWRYIEDIQAAITGGDLLAADNVTIKLEHDQEWQEELVIGLGVNAGNLFTVETVRDASTDGKAAISAADVSNGFQLPYYSGETEKLSDLGFEEWTNPTTPVNWTIYNNANGSVTREDTNVQKGNYSVRATRTGAGVFGIASGAMTIAYNRTMRITCHHYNAENAVYPAVQIWRGPAGGPYQYLRTDGGWDGNSSNVVPLAGTTALTGSNSVWTKSYLDFNTNPDTGFGTTYYAMFLAGGVNNYVIIDSVSLRRLLDDDMRIQNWNFEDWAGGVPANWTSVDIGGPGGTLSESQVGGGAPDDRAYLGTSCARFTPAVAANQTKLLHTANADVFTLLADTAYRVSLSHMEHIISSAHTAAIQVGIIRGTYTGVGDVYYQWGTGTWSPALSFYPLTPRRYWTVDHADFTSDTAGNYTLVIMPLVLQVASIGVGCHHYVDRATISRRNIDTTEHVVDPQFTEWDSNNILVYHNHIDKTSTHLSSPPEKTYVAKSETPRFHDSVSQGVSLHCFSEEKVGIYHTVEDLVIDTLYRAQIFANTHHTKSVDADEMPIHIQIAKNYGTIGEEFWDPTTSAFVATETDALEMYSNGWDLASIEFTTESDASATYTIIAYADTPTSLKYNEFQIFVDEASMAAVSVDEIYSSHITWMDKSSGPVGVGDPVTSGDPVHVFVTGILRSISVNNYQLHKEGVFTDSPRKWCWSYDSANRVLYINVGEDPGDLTIEMVVRDRVVDTNEKSRITLSDFICKFSKYDAVRLREGTGGSRPEDLTATLLTVENANACGIQAGYRNHSDHEANHYLHLTPKDTTIDQCEVLYANRCVITNRSLIGGDYSASTEGQYYSANNIAVYAGQDYKTPASSSDGAPAGTQIIQYCNVLDDRPLLNADYYSNGIQVSTGAEAQIYGNLITRTNHGIVVHDWAVIDAPGGACDSCDILYNKVYLTGDDNCWLAGVRQRSRVAYNIFAYSNDNNLEIDACSIIEIYNNIMHRGFNENLGIYNDPGVCWIYNNIFHHWGEFRDNGLQGALEAGTGAAIGFYSVIFFDECYINYNVYYADPAKPSTEATVFHIDYVSKPTPTQWKTTYNFDRNSFFFQDPRFEDLALYDFRLKYNSPCIDAGIDLRYIRALVSVSGQTSDFDNQNAVTDLIDPDSQWPDALQYVAGPLLGPPQTMDIGPIGYITDKNLLVVTDVAGTAQTGLTPVVDVYKASAGGDLTPVPTVYEVGNGAYAFATRVIMSTVVRVDCDPGLGDAERYKYFEVIPDLEYLKTLSGNVADIPDIYANTQTLLTYAAQADTSITEALALMFKNTVRRDRNFDIVDGEEVLTDEVLDAYDGPLLDNGATLIARYRIHYKHTGTWVRRMEHRVDVPITS